MIQIQVGVSKMYDDVILPEYKTLLSAGCDVRAYLSDETKYPLKRISFVPGQTVVVPTGLKFSVPDGYEMQIRARSGMASKTKLRIANQPGTLDADYRGELMIIMENISPLVYDCEGRMDGINTITHQDRIAQLIFAPIVQANFIIKDSLDETERGEGGFGSTGIV